MKRERRAPKNAANVSHPENTVDAMIVATFPDWAELESLSAMMAVGVREMMIDVPGDRLAATFHALISILRTSAKRGDNAAVQNLLQAAVATTRSLDELAETPIAGPLICELALRSPDWPMLASPKTLRQKTEENISAKDYLERLGVGKQSTPRTAGNINQAKNVWQARAAQIVAIVERFRSLDPSAPQSESSHIASLILKGSEEAMNLAKRRGPNPFARKTRQPAIAEAPDLRLMRAHPRHETLPAPNSSTIGQKWWRRVYSPILLAIWEHEPEKRDADAGLATARNRPHDHIRRALVSLLRHREAS